MHHLVENIAHFFDDTGLLTFVEHVEKQLVDGDQRLEVGEDERDFLGRQQLPLLNLLDKVLDGIKGKT